MKKDLFYILIISLTIACAAIQPEREYDTELWEIDWVNACIYRLDDRDVVVTLCEGDDNFPESVVSIELWQWIREREFADKSISQCKEWR